jgi:soluble lytic murein transglycosylase
VAIYPSQANLGESCRAILGRRTAFAKNLLRRHAPTYLLASAIVTLASTDALLAASHKQATAHASKASKAESHKHPPVIETKRVSAHRSKLGQAEHHKKRPETEAKRGERAPGPRTILATDSSDNVSPTPQLVPDLVTLKQAIQLVQQHKLTEAAKLTASIDDPIAQKLLQWALLRDPDSPADFDQYNSFIQANPSWPSMPLFRRRAEARLWQERRDAAMVRRFVGEQPTSSHGRLAIARLLLAEGDRSGATREVRTVWHAAELSAELETAVANAFHDQLTAADDNVRMDHRIGSKDFAAAMRAAKRLGPTQVAIVKACEEAEANTKKSEALLAAIPKEVQSDLGYALCRLHWLLAHDDVAAAVKLVGEVSGDDLRLQDTDEWWRECRTLARRLLDLGDPNTAYRVVREVAAPANPYYRAEYHFMPGWIALRFLSDPVTAVRHFAKVDEGSSDPIVLARAAYWRGRAFEAAGRLDEMKEQYARAARYPTAYYGQLARARIGMSEIAVRPLPRPQPNLDDVGNDVARCFDLRDRARRR